MADVRAPRARRGRVGIVVAALALLAGLGPAASAEAAEATCGEVLIPMSDGTRLHGWMRHGPNVAAKRPILWTMTPYTNTGCPGGTAFGTFTKEMFDKSTAVSISYRGTGASEGEQDAWGPGDRKDVQEVGDWLAKRPYADGLVPTGASAEGAWIAFALDHPAVRAALWITSCADGYQGCVRSGGQLAGGAVILTQGELQGYVQGLGDRLRNGTTNPPPPAQLAATVLNAYPAFTEDNNGPFWSSRLGFKYLRDVRKPVMLTTDLYDYVSKGMYLAYERTPAANAWLSTALGHNNPRQVLDDTTTLGKLAKAPVRQFLSKYVYGQRHVPQPARLRLMTNLGTVSGYKRAQVLLRDEPDWPLPSTKWRRLYLGPAALSLGLPAPGDDLTPMATTNGPKGELRTQLAVIGAIGAASKNDDLLDGMLKATLDDLRPDEAAGLTYTTPPLASDTEVTGPVVLEVNATATAPNFDWQVRLTDVHPDGRSSWITDGQLRASLRRVDDAQSVKNAAGDYIRPWLPMTTHEPVPLAEPVRYVIELAPTSNVFRKGDRIRLDIQPLADGYLDSGRSAGIGALQIHRGGIEPSRLILPVIPSRCQRGELAADGVGKPSCGDDIRFDRQP